MASPIPTTSDQHEAASSRGEKSWLHPLRRRWLILAIIFCAMVLNYVDRQIISILKPTLKSEFHINDEGYATLVNAFLVCYATMYPVAGWLADRFSVRWVMLSGIIGWSTACLCAGFTKTIGQLTFFRRMLGLTEPLAYPAQLRVVTTWFPGTLRATANSVCVAGGTVGAIIAPPMVAFLTTKWNWHAAFIFPAILGLIVAVLWWLIYRDPPPEMGSSRREEALTSSSANFESKIKNEQSRPTSAATKEVFTWPQLWRTRSLWGILLIRFISDPVWYFCLFWLPGYLQEKSGLTLAQIGMVGWIPFLAADLGGIGSAAWSDSLVRRGKAPLQARKIMLTAMAFLAPVCALTPHLPHPAATLILFSIVGAVCLSWLFSMSVVIAETFPVGNVSSVLGIAGGFGAAGGMLFNQYVGKMIGNIGATKMFLVMAVLHPLAVLVLWTMIKPERPKNSL